VKAKQKFSVLIERDAKGFYVASVPSLKGCHTQAKNLDTLMQRVQEVIKLSLEVEGRSTSSLKLVGILQIVV
jgi:predicted RNase H-like HicB family nuclease